MSKIIHLFSAVPLAGDPAISLGILVEIEEPRMDTLHEQIDHQWSEARKLYDALANALPQGVTDKLFAIMAEQQAKHFMHSFSRLAEMSRGDNQPA